jgi:hypothetical protein
MMASRYAIFCLILFFAVLGLGFKNYEIWSQPAGAVIKREVPRKPETRTENLAAVAVPAEATPRDAYKVIAEKNLFHPERQEFPVTGTDQSRPSARPQIALYGVILGGDYQSATIVNPGKPLMKGEREAKTVKVGDRVGDYRVAKIQEDRIVMDSDGDSFEVLLYDPSAPKKRIEVKTPVQPVAVTSSAGGPSPAPGTPSPPVPAASPRTPVGSLAPGVHPGPQIPQPAPQVGASKPVEQTPGTALQPQTSPSTTTPATGIWRSRRQTQPVDPATPQGK